jgi:hypothetical protein
MKPPRLAAALTIAMLAISPASVLGQEKGKTEAKN